MNLKEANLYDYPIWYKLYSTRFAYSMRGLRPVDWDELINTMTNNDEIFDLYYKLVFFFALQFFEVYKKSKNSKVHNNSENPINRHYWKNSPLRPQCLFECKKRILCQAKSGRSHDRKHFCEGVESKIDEGNSKSWGAWFYRGLSVS